MPKLAASEIKAALATVPLWKKRGAVIHRTFDLVDFVAAMKFVNVVAQAAELAQHHPDIDIRWNRVTLTLTTHDAGGLTTKDFALAWKCEVFACYPNEPRFASAGMVENSLLIPSAGKSRVASR